MTLSILISWVVVVCGVMLACPRLTLRPSIALSGIGAALWVLCALYINEGAVGGTLTLALLVCGSAGLILAGVWASAQPTNQTADKAAAASTTDTMPQRSEQESAQTTRLMYRAIVEFDEWLEAHRNEPDPWPSFSEFIRSTLIYCGGATRSRPFRIMSEGDGLLPLREIDPGNPPPSLPAQRGIYGHVLSTGQPYFAFDSSRGDLLEVLADESTADCKWCFPIRRGGERIGLVAVGELSGSHAQDIPYLTAVAGLIGHFWCTLAEVCRSRVALSIDSASGLLNRAEFLDLAERVVNESNALREPVVLVVFTVEGLRRLDDTGEWDIGQKLVVAVSQLLRSRIRQDDCLGRFDEGRFLLLLRRVNSDLATLIIKQLMAHMTELCDHHEQWKRHVEIRCGVTGSGGQIADLRALIIEAFRQCRIARERQLPLFNDLDYPDPADKQPAEEPVA